MPPTPAHSAPSAARSRPAITRFLVLVVVLLVADLAVKAIAFQRVAGTPATIERAADGTLMPLPQHSMTVLVPKVLALQLTLNEGAVFGLGQGGRWIFVVFSIIATAVIWVTFQRSKPGALLLHCALAAVLAGALGNLYDRLVYGVVRDMLLLFPRVKLPFGWSWPDGSRGLYPWIFNVADVCLVIGLLVLIVLMWRDGEGREGGREVGR